MSSQWPDLKKEMDNISVPMDKLDSIITNTIKENRIKKSKKKMALYSLGTAVAAFGLFIGSASVSPTMAKIASNIPIIGTFFNDAWDEGLRIAGKQGLTQILEQSAKDNGITLTINEVFYDGTRFTLGYTQESLFAIGDLERPNIKVNGKNINFSSGYSGDFVTPQKYKGIIDITPTEELPEEFDMKIRIDAVGSIPGKWEFEFPVKQSNEVIVIRPQEVKMIEQAEVQITSLKLGPAGTNLSVKIIKDEENTRVDPYALNFYMIDEQGNVLDTISGSGSGDIENGKEKAKLDFLYSPLKEGVKKVRVIPYINPKYEGLGEASIPLDDQSLPFVVDQGEFEKVFITDITYLKDKMVVYFDVQSDAIIENNLSRNPIWLEDTNGKHLMSKDKPFAERIEGNKFKQEFATGKKKGLLLKTIKYPNPITYEEFEIEIP
ncbi:DUF4179 domain-containing protein [Cytobacillus depressus]|uniref:DUF4179 domain-containing protein n=1 Tax=Cytobacillus depressus TaxID=1602942 RepID=A0A6L3V5W0_9BACI|nr:DUF4179 domain-containing protein [Cytobacillus depressus]KAB2334882.1 DUF4179 domain-containing protein [Cytobacillus depressus]